MNVDINEIRKGLNCLEGNSENLENARNAFDQISSISMGNFTPICEDYSSNINDYLAQISHIGGKLKSMRSDNTDFIFLANSIYKKLLALTGGPDYSALEEEASFDGYNWWMNGEIIDADEWLAEHTSEKRFFYDPNHKFENIYIYDSDNIISANTFNKNLIPRNPDAEAMCLHIYSVLVNKYGYTHNFAVAALNNMAAESAFLPTSINDAKTSVGVCQWDYEPRVDEFLKYIGDKPENYTNKYQKLKKLQGVDLDTQLAFMNHEIEESYNHNNDAQNDLYCQAHNENTQYSLNEQSRNFTLCYEIPDNAGEAADTRTAYTSSIEDLINANRIETID